MSKDPLGFIARLNAMSLMLITPEFYKIRRLRGEQAGKISHATHTFCMKPDFTDINAWPRIVEIAWLKLNERLEPELSSEFIIKPSGFKISPTARDSNQG